MNTPTLELLISSNSQIGSLTADIKLYKALVSLLQAPQFEDLGEHTEPATLLPTGERAIEGQSLDDQPTVWFREHPSADCIRLTRNWGLSSNWTETWVKEYLGRRLGYPIDVTFQQN